jgi:hypothetical protein
VLPLSQSLSLHRCTRGNARSDKGARYHPEYGCRPVKLNGGCACQLVPQSLDGASHFAGRNLRFHKRHQTHGQAEDCAKIANPALGCRPVEPPVRGLDQSCIGIASIRTATLCTKAKKSRHGAARRDSEDCATARVGARRAGMVCPLLDSSRRSSHRWLGSTHQVDCHPCNCLVRKSCKWSSAFRWALFLKPCHTRNWAPASAYAPISSGGRCGADPKRRLSAK